MSDFEMIQCVTVIKGDFMWIKKMTFKLFFYFCIPCICKCKISIIIKLLNFIIKCFIFYLDICLLYTSVDNGYFKADLDDCSNDKSINTIHSKDTCKHQ